jgi:hypothetical protein
MRILLSLCLLWLLAPRLHAAIPPDQRKDDLRQLASLYAKTYGPYEWKKQLLGFDPLDLKPWFERALAAKTDMEYLDVLVQYIASFDDGHLSIRFPYVFDARLGFVTDVYDSRVVIDSIDRFQLPAAAFPFEVGDELVSLDGITAEDWLQRLSPYRQSANRRSTRRLAAELITIRRQAIIPWAAQIGDSATVVIRRQSGEEETYEIPWDKFGDPVEEIGPVPSPVERVLRAMHAGGEGFAGDDATPVWLKPLEPWTNVRTSFGPVEGVRGYGSRVPYYSLPANFQTRLGQSSAHAFYSGVYETGGLRLGFLRIPSFSPSIGTASALQQLDVEIAFFNANTDALVVDVTRNPGGSVLFVNEIARRLIPYRFRSLGFRLRATANFVASFNSSLALARVFGLPDDVVEAQKQSFEEVLRAFREERGLTAPLPLTSAFLELDPATTPAGAPLAYSKPLIMLIDEFSASGGDMLPATLQDARRGPLVGYRTMGLGGSVVDFSGPSYTESSVRSTVSLIQRNQDVVTPEYPAAPYIENIGVRPDVELDYMSRENLREAGRPFVNWFTEVLLKHARGEL